MGVVLLERLSMQPIRPEEVIRPLVIFGGGTAIAAVAAARVFRARDWPSMIVSAAILLFFAYPVPAGVVLGLITWWIAIWWLRRLRSHSRTPLRSPFGPNRAATIFMACLLVISGYSAFASPLPATSALPVLPTPAAQGGPDIFLLLLDGYPSSGALLTEFGFDNEPFESQLESSGFVVSSGARSSYNKTWLTVASLLSGTYVNQHLDLDGALGTPGQQARRLHQVINDAPVLAYLRERGYEVVSIPSSVSTADVTAGARVLETGQVSTLEASLLATSVVGRFAPELVVDLLAADHRAAVDGQFDLLASVGTEDSDKPRLVLAHFMSPHPPFVLEQKPSYLYGCFPTCSFWSTTVAETRLSPGEYSERLGAQVAALNERVADAVETIAATNPEAVIIVMSDHGARHHLDGFDEHFDVLFAARTPARPSTFQGEIALTNVFRRLFATYFDEHLPDLEYVAWVSDWYEPLRLERFH